MTEFDTQYQKILKKIMQDGVEEFNERTKHSVKALPGETLEIEPEDGFPLLTLRKIPVKLFVAEQIWFLTGSRKPSDFLTKFTKVWDEFTNLDGLLPTAYGYRWRHHFGRDQIELLVNLLQKEPSSRGGVVISWDPASDGLNPHLKETNGPCNYTFTSNIIGDKLHLHNIARSNDIILGCPYDVAGFALLQRILAAKLGVGVGKYTHSISNAHIYDIHYQVARELVHRKNHHQPIYLEAEYNYYDRASKGDESLVAEIVAKINNQYKPLGTIKGLRVVL